ncbi:PilZ domain-containing protein [Paraburkholderia caballeronis]|uniref:PilZ domain-containing protein n=1 Tax=Paraburkholderia caballeronis TaxID=416943 RepID=A0A1H7RNE0_9BURK|nr:PilZ domain-containing protein [Paraburkholderia caballeronis]PXW23128.1 PilZ domain-containing protein [Paraburkholderia caballeronis]PXW97792.1 PilZ domain-containing protein [Paraburkholderia caballeronis]RAJ94762.1 PilZ domain-containing protein [Paraburkholderia caballeronis]SEE61413.1 PilZ domain-containing protein [Paraburkholderia caballeronis]SEL61820.1 PilZ domain-containing protein [Paraburkholderia caballeronis]
MLIKLSSGDVGLGEPTDFAVYSSDGKLLLQKGYVVDSPWLLDRLYRLGHRENVPAQFAASSGASAAMEPASAGAADKSALLFGAAAADHGEAGESAVAARKGPTLPNLRQKVEFFHLTQAGSTDALRMELAGVIPDEALIARHTRQDAPTLTTGMVYEARLFTGSRVFRFNTRLLPESAGPLGCHFLKYPEVVSQAIVRRHHRVPTSIIGKLQTHEYQRPTADVLIENMSSVGFGISTEDDFLIVGQSAQLAMSLSVDSRTRPVAVVVEVRNRRQDGDRFRYGLEIVQVSDDARREIKDFVLESVASS